MWILRGTFEGVSEEIQGGSFQCVLGDGIKWVLVGNRGLQQLSVELLGVSEGA